MPNNIKYIPLKIANLFFGGIWTYWCLESSWGLGESIVTAVYGVNELLNLKNILVMAETSQEEKKSLK